ncbi:MAG: hypothetical protein O7E52_12725 [Candidatus Poribacteria bacterium]|nr:hypothetical protein [Candidatus Poribacteria bacterium]
MIEIFPVRQFVCLPRTVRLAAVLTGSFIVFHGPPSLAAESYENPPTFRASQILPPYLLSGPSHRVLEEVQNDGYVNRYVIESKYGKFTGITTTILRKRIGEIYALDAMDKVAKTTVFKDSAVEAAEDVWVGIKNLVTSPVDSVSGAVSGVGRVFTRVGEHLFGSKRSEAEDNRLKALIGFSKTKREYADDFGVDVYSKNAVLQDHLNSISWTGYTGGISIAGVMSAVPGGAGILVSTSGGTRLMNEVYRTTAPVDLRRMNREKLAKMGINETVAELFIDNTIFSPRQQTDLVFALEEMEGVGNREAFAKFAILTNSDDVATFRQRMAQMYAAYHKSVAPLDRFILLGKDLPIKNMNIARTRSGIAVFLAPLDYLVWTENMARIFYAIDSAVGSQTGIKGKELWLAGNLSPTARQQIENAGWRVNVNAEVGLLGEQEGMKESLSYN